VIMIRSRERLASDGSSGVAVDLSVAPAIMVRKKLGRNSCIDYAKKGRSGYSRATQSGARGPQKDCLVSPLKPPSSAAAPPQAVLVSALG
jgi:hypothetical protein